MDLDEQALSKRFGWIVATLSKFFCEIEKFITEEIVAKAVVEDDKIVR
jgi:hypothetical protein